MSWCIRAALAAVFLFPSAVAQAPVAEVADGWGEVPLLDRPLLMARYSAPAAPMPAAHRAAVIEAMTSQLQGAPALFGLSTPHYTLRRGPAYQMLYLESADTDYGIYFQDGYFILNARTVQAGGTPERVAKSTLHETFHAFQNPTPWARSGARAGWVIEGMADAAAAILYGRLRGRTAYQLYTQPDDSQAGQAVGLRAYDAPLHRMAEVRRIEGKAEYDKEDYRTNSFWRFLASHGPENGRIFKTVLDVPPTASTEDTALDALDRALKGSQAWQGGVAQAYPAFIADFAELPVREGFPNARFYTTDRWLNNVFADGGCLPLRFGGSTLDWSARIQIQPVAARCLNVRLDYANGQAADADSAYYFISVEARSVNAEDCRDLALGTNGRTVTAGPITRGANGCRVAWIFPYGPRDPTRTGNRQPVVISNVNAIQPPSQTTLKRIDVSVSVPFAEAVASGGSVQPGQPPSPIPPATGRRRGSRPPSPRIPNGASVTRTDPSPEAAREVRAACDPAMLAANLCGPQTSISLQLGENGDLTSAMLGDFGAGGPFRHLFAPLMPGESPPPSGLTTTLGGEGSSQGSLTVRPSRSRRFRASA